MIGRMIAHYRVLQLLGRGGMGEVYLAQDTTLPRKVALKLLPEERQQDRAYRTRLLREAESAAAISHPFICSSHEIGEFEGTDFIAMEYVEGESLKDRLDKGPFPVPKALPIASEIAEALEKAQAKGIVHRDLKPANIMLTTEGHPKILDFGLAKRVTPVEGVESEDQTITNLTQQGSTGASSLILDCVVERGNPADSNYVQPFLERHRQLYGKVPRQSAWDGGFASAANLRWAKEQGVQDVAFSKKCGLTVESMVRSSWVYKQLKRFRAGIEGCIGTLKHTFGLHRCSWKGWPHFQSYVHASVLTYNLVVLARLLL